MSVWSIVRARFGWSMRVTDLDEQEESMTDEEKRKLVQQRRAAEKGGLTRRLSTREVTLPKAPWEDDE